MDPNAQSRGILDQLSHSCSELKVRADQDDALFRSLEEALNPETNFSRVEKFGQPLICLAPLVPPRLPSTLFLASCFPNSSKSSSGSD
jgi:hypothetical protein